MRKRRALALMGGVILLAVDGVSTQPASVEVAGRTLSLNAQATRTRLFGLVDTYRVAVYTADSERGGRAAEPLHTFGAEEETYVGPYAVDPLTNVWDLGAEPLRFNWNAGFAQHGALCRMFQKLGISALRLSLPYHDHRMPAELHRAVETLQEIGRQVRFERGVEDTIAVEDREVFDLESGLERGPGHARSCVQLHSTRRVREGTELLSPVRRGSNSGVPATRGLTQCNRDASASRPRYDPRRMALPASLRALSHRDFRMFWLAQLVSLTGTWLQSLGQAWLVLELTDSAFMLGLVGFALWMVGTGLSIDEARTARWLLGDFPNAALWQPWTLRAVTEHLTLVPEAPPVVGAIVTETAATIGTAADWGKLLEETATIATAIFLAVLSILFNISGSEVLLRREQTAAIARALVDGDDFPPR